MNFPEQPAVIQAQRPLVLPRDAQSGNQGSAGGQAASGTAPGRSPEPTGTSPASAPATNASSPGATGPSSGTPPRTELAAMLARAVSGQPVSAQAFAKALGSSIRDSGLFYESHLSNLAFGKHDLAALKQEPQAQLGLAATTRPKPQQPRRASQPRGLQTRRRPRRRQQATHQARLRHRIAPPTLQITLPTRLTPVYEPTVSHRHPQHQPRSRQDRR